MKDRIKDIWKYRKWYVLLPALINGLALVHNHLTPPFELVSAIGMSVPLVIAVIAVIVESHVKDNKRGKS